MEQFLVVELDMIGIEADIVGIPDDHMLLESRMIDIGFLVATKRI